MKFRSRSAEFLNNITKLYPKFKSMNFGVFKMEFCSRTPEMHKYKVPNVSKILLHSYWDIQNGIWPPDRGGPQIVSSKKFQNYIAYVSGHAKWHLAKKLIKIYPKFYCVLLGIFKMVT